MSTPQENRVYNHVWRRVRKAVLERDAWTCQIRGDHCMTRADCVDHVIPWRSGGALYDPDNLRASCTPCNAGRVWRQPKRGRPSREW